MRMQIKKILPIWISLVILLLSGCQSTRSTLPTGGPTMAQVYKEAMAESDRSSIETLRQQIQSPIVFNGKEELVGYTRTAGNEVNQLFPELPNPQVALYIFPHLAEEGVPVPGYTTAFYLYKSDHYALPGEVR